jgi:hypothetical protein
LVGKNRIGGLENQPKDGYRFIFPIQAKKTIPDRLDVCDPALGAFLFHF